MAANDDFKGEAGREISGICAPLQSLGQRKNDGCLQELFEVMQVFQRTEEDQALIQKAACVRQAGKVSNDYEKRLAVWRKSSSNVHYCCNNIRIYNNIQSQAIIITT